MAGLAVTALVFGSASLALARGHHGGMMGGYAEITAQVTTTTRPIRA